MSCNCAKPDKTQLWTPVPEFRQATEMLPGENIECYAKRAGNVSGMHDDVAEKPLNKIENNVFVTDLNLKVDITFKLTPDSTAIAKMWEIAFDGTPGIPSGMGISLDPNTGKVTGTIPDTKANTQYKVVVTAKDASSGIIDMREYNFFPKKGSKEDTVTFVFPYTPNGRITSPFGNRVHPVTKASKMHTGIDISQPGSELGFILAAGDGTVVKTGAASGFGNWIHIEHRSSDGKLVATTLYAHMKASEIYVKVGQKVSAGQKIALEGNEGVGTAAHLHFELHKGGYKNPVDPAPYLTGTFVQADNNVPGQANTPSTSSTVTNANVGMTSGEATAAQVQDCPDALPNQAPATTSTNPEPAKVPVSPATASVQEAIQKALDEDPDLTEEDKKLLMFMAKIESRFIADAKNPTSSARGVYQMLDKSAVFYYNAVGIPATEANRNNPYFATKAQIAFYKREQLKYWNDFNASGKSSIASKTLAPEVKARYTNYTKGEFIYGLIHHDGVGNAVTGSDKQGVDYYRKKIRET